MKIKKHIVFTLSALALLVTSILLIGMNVSTGAIEPQPIYLHGPPLTPIHMNSNKTLTPVHMHSKQGVINFLWPWETEWHELYPNYCTDWYLTSWNDLTWDDELSPNDQIDMTDEEGNTTWYHVDKITYTLNLSSLSEPVERIFVELKTPGWDPFMVPICTFWHEVWPNYSNVYHCIAWIDGPPPNDIVDFCDTITLNQTDWHVDGVATDLILREKIMDPRCTWWHEIYPDYCKWYHLTSWEDTQLEGEEGYGMLSPCDQIDMTEEESGITTWYHVDRVTVTINVTLESDPTKWMKIELKTYYFEQMYDVFKIPWDSEWHEVYPSYSNVYLLTNWDPEYDDNCNGVLDPCDYIWLLNLTNPFAKPERYHIEDMSYDLILNEKITDPVCTDWHALYPADEYCNWYHVSDWADNLDGVLSPCDYVKLNATDWYHVENVTLTLNVSSWDFPGEFILLEAVIPFERMYWPKIEPWESLWHEVWPNFCTNYSVTVWTDNCNGVLDPCDNVTLLPIVDIVPATKWHVEEVAVEMVVKKKPFHDVAVIDVFSQYPQVDQGNVDPINVTVENQGNQIETVDVYAFYDGNLAAPKQNITLNPGDVQTLTFAWNTTGVPLGTYTISANATIPIDDDPTDNIRVAVNTQEVIPEFPPAIILPLFMILSLITVVFKLKKKKQ